MVQKIERGDDLYAIIIRSSYSKPGINFFTPDDYSQQLGYMKHPKGHVIDPHIHNEVTRSVYLTQEVLIIKKGKLRVDFYDDNKYYLFSEILCDGDIILLSKGGHGFEVLEELEMIEVKQGPYSGDQDKSKFDSGLPNKLTIISEMK